CFGSSGGVRMTATAAEARAADKRTRTTVNRTRGRIRRQRVTVAIFLGPAIVYMVLFFGYPVVKNVLMGFQEYTISTFFTGEAPWVWFDNYAEVLSSPLFRTALFNTLVFTIGSIVGQFCRGLPIALFFRRRFPLSGLLRSLILLPWSVPLIVASAVWRWLLDTDAGALNRFLMGTGLTDT